jgi:SAM-dependent methyltransferase
VLELPFAEGSFDLVVSAWVIETVTDPRLAVSELLRALAPDGRLLYTFCSLPRGWVARARTAPLHAAVKRGFAGEFLDEQRTPWHDCESSQRRRLAAGSRPRSRSPSAAPWTRPCCPPMRRARISSEPSDPIVEPQCCLWCAAQGLTRRPLTD